jgi:anion-transporting  ArsA/GET3 family ATPase
MTVDKARILLAQAIDDPQLILVTGKGGVGKTTIAKLLVKLAHAAGIRALLIGFDNTSSKSVPGDLEQVTLEPDAVMIEYLETHGFGPLASKLVQSGVIDSVATAIPGIRDLLMLGKIKQLVNLRKWDLIVVDSPASGHALSLFSSPDGLINIASDGPIAKQSDDVINLLHDHQATGVVIVAIPEETPVQESIELHEAITAKLDMRVVSVIVNQIPKKPPLDCTNLDPGSAEWHACSFLSSKHEQASRQIERIRSAFEIPVVELPSVDPGLGSDDASTRLLMELLVP